MTFRTQHFANCWGVFEGGGVRAAAFAGAYQAAVEAGISFSRVAGTSAGAITAALIAAGATPKFVTQKLGSKDFRDFLRPVDPKHSPFTERSTWLRTARNMTSGRARNAIELALYSGLYSSHHIQEWLEELLKELLVGNNPEVARRQVRFSDLLKPLHIISVDIAQGRPRIWSKETNAEESVALAARCSSNIPFFFQAIPYNDELLVDGGILSNTPSFVYAASMPIHAGRFSERLLAFQLDDDGTPSALEITSLYDFALAVANTVISGSTAIQMELQPDVFRIRIPTGSLKATDFDKVTPSAISTLMTAGYAAVENFVRHERENVSSLRPTTRYRGFDEKLLVLVQALTDSTSSIWISDRNSYWVYFIFPALLHAIRRGVNVQFFTSTVGMENGTQRAHEEYRRKLLHRMGVAINIMDRTPFNGFVADAGTDRTFVGISSRQGLVGKDYEYSEEQIKVYSAYEDAPVVESFSSSLSPTIGIPSRPQLSFRSCQTDLLFGRLRNVPQYKNARFSVEQVNLNSRLSILQPLVKEYKYMQIDALIREFTSNGVELFFPQEIVFEDATSSIITPPVIERVDGENVVIDGHTRTLHCLKNNIDKMVAVVVENVSAPLPGKPSPLARLALSSGTITVKDFGFNMQYFRDIEAYVHPIHSGY
jgi:predicted acylesterase/phospholipase RssA